MKPSRSSTDISLRTVAAETPRPALWVTVWEPTGCALSTYCSTIARRIAALRSSSSVIQPGPVAIPCWHSMLPSANRPREQQSGSYIGSEEPAVSGQHDAIVDPVHETRRPASSSTTVGAASATGAPRRVRSASAHASSARGTGSRALAPPRRPTSRPRSRRCSARACARSTSAGPRCGRARRSRSRGTRPRSNRAGCGGTPRRASPSSTPRTTRGRRPRARDSARR